MKVFFKKNIFYEKNLRILVKVILDIEDLSLLEVWFLRIGWNKNVGLIMNRIILKLF